jgi:ABC-type sugar transport system permease subunit
MPFSMISIAAALTAIPKGHYEVASLDGAGSAARLWCITLPALRPALLAAACIVTIDATIRKDIANAVCWLAPTMVEAEPFQNRRIMPPVEPI